MKSKIKRLLALVLCLTMVLNGNVSLLASDEVTAEDQVVAEAVEEMMEEVAEDATEEVTEEAIEVVAEEETEVVDEATEVLNEEEATEEVVEEEIADDSTGDTLKLQTELNGTIITMTGPKSSFPEGTDYSVSASEISEEAISDVEASLRKVELETNEKIVSYKAFDIKLIVDGKEAQPVGDVNVTFQGKEVKEQVASAENVEVYHVDEEKQVAVEVEGDVKNNDVVMTTDHFSTYVIATSSAKVNVTVEHLLLDGSPIYQTTTIELTYKERLEDISVAKNYSVERVTKVTDEGEKDISGTDVITADTTYRVYYSPTTGTLTGDVQVFDYQVRPSNTGEKSINIESNYEECDDNTKVTMGKNDQNDRAQQYQTYIGSRNVNAYTGGSVILEGIITGVDYETGALKMGQSSAGLMHEPGFFTHDEKYGKQILEGYSLLFDRSGDTYTLNSIWKNGSRVKSAGANFWLLDDIIKDHPDGSNKNNHNFFFGVRYDIEFSIGDYVGPLNYTFKGDDDLWVVLDAKNSSTGGNIIVDIGGIHQVCTGTVDIWSALDLDPDTITPEQKEQKHTLTILYLERGGEESNCNMQFTLPNSKVVSSIINPTTFEFTKVNTKGEPVAGAVFELYNDNNELLAISDENGKVVFNNLFDGTYYIKETIAPEGYVKSSKVYKLTIVDSEPTMTLLDSSESVTSIVNYTHAENIIHDKTVSVSNFDSRIYEIVLTAKTNYEPEAIQATEIVDVIDSRFTLTDECKAELEKNENVKITVEQTTGETTIKWLGDAAVITKEGWKQVIYVQAKSDFIGGNAIPTNGPESGIEVGNDKLSFPQPSVNVKLLDFTVTGQEITVYKGDIVNTAEFANVLAKSLKVTKLYDAKDDLFEVLSEGLSQVQLETLNETKTLEIPYSYKGTKDVEGKFTLQLVLDPNAPDNATKGEEAIANSHVEMVSGDKVEIYRLVVSYIPLSVAERMALEGMELITPPASNGGTKVTAEDLDVKQVDYVVNVISGEIQITKTLKEAAKEDKEFKFLVSDANGNTVTEVSITVPAGQLSASYTGNALKDLAKGTYTITERDVNGYVLDTVEINDNLTNCQSSKVDTEVSKSVTFVLGKDVNGEDVIKSLAYDLADGGTRGVANFTNDNVYKDWSIVKRSSSNESFVLKGAEFELKSETNTYKGISDENGVIVWYHAGSDTPLQSMEYIVKGIYTLKETKAPEGYSLTDLTWTVTVAAKGYLKNIECSDKEFNGVSIDDNGVFTCFIENTPLYELPQSGGLGIYTYTIGGILLMAFATLILYKNRRKEVLAR